MKKPVQIIKVTNNHIGEELVQTVNSRGLWKELGVGKDYSNWIKAQIETLDFEENLDYLKVAQKGELSKTGQTEINYIFSLDAAKHIALASRTPKGKEVRKYFIELEKYARYILEKKAEASDSILYSLKNQQVYIEKRQEVTLDVISDFVDFGGKTIDNLRNLIKTELNSLLILNKALIDSIEEPVIQKMYMSIMTSIEDKRDNLIKTINEQVANVNKHNHQIYQISETKLKEFEKDFQTAAEKIDAVNTN